MVAPAKFLLCKILHHIVPNITVRCIEYDEAVLHECESLIDVCASFVADRQAAGAIEPGVAGLDYLDTDTDKRAMCSSANFMRS